MSNSSNSKNKTVQIQVTTTEMVEKKTVKNYSGKSVEEVLKSIKKGISPKKKEKEKYIYYGSINNNQRRYMLNTYWRWDQKSLYVMRFDKDQHPLEKSCGIQHVSSRLHRPDGFVILKKKPF